SPGHRAALHSGGAALPRPPSALPCWCRAPRIPPTGASRDRDRGCATLAESRRLASSSPGAAWRSGRGSWTESSSIRRRNVKPSLALLLLEGTHTAPGCSAVLRAPTARSGPSVLRLRTWYGKVGTPLEATAG